MSYSSTIYGGYPFEECLVLHKFVYLQLDMIVPDLMKNKKNPKSLFLQNISKFVQIMSCRLINLLLLLLLLLFNMNSAIYSGHLALELQSTRLTDNTWEFEWNLGIWYISDFQVYLICETLNNVFHQNESRARIFVIYMVLSPINQWMQVISVITILKSVSLIRYEKWKNY